MEGRLTRMDLIFINTVGRAAAEKVGEMSKEKTAKAEDLCWADRPYSWGQEEKEESRIKYKDESVRKEEN